jgi:hypothetical protein
VLDDQQTSKKKGCGRKGAVAILGVAGGGAYSASASTNPAGNTQNSTRVLLG